MVGGLFLHPPFLSYYSSFTLTLKLIMPAPVMFPINTIVSVSVVCF